MIKEPQMTHSGGKPHIVGDQGQRYEVRAIGWPDDGESVISWTDSKGRAESVATSILTAPGCTASRVVDREFEKWKAQLAVELSKTFDLEGGQVDGAKYIEATGDDCWREMFDDELTPADAAREDARDAQ
jgi:hypothetical protein